MPLVTCPSGLAFNARKWKYKDRKTLLDADLIRKGQTQIKMLELVAGPVEAVGPYDFQAGGAIDWRKVALADISTALIDIRCMTKPLYEFDVNCPACGRKLELQVDLMGSKRMPMSKEAIDHLRSDTPLELELCGCKIKLRLLRGRDMTQLVLGAKNSPAESIEVQQCLHIVELTPPGKEKLTEQTFIREFYGDQDDDGELGKGLTRFLDATGGGVDTDVEQSCRSCRREVRVSLPLGESFFAPSLEPSRTSTVQG
jgi:hypothetical protein